MVRVRSPCKGVAFRHDRHGEEIIVDGDVDRLVQVVTNILLNAAKFTPPGRAVYVTSTIDDGDALIEVRDEGQGIDPSLLPRIFDLFSQGAQTPDRPTGGLGLGLAIARSIVTAHGGRIEAISPGQGLGTRLLVRIPLVMAEVSRVESEPAPVAPLPSYGAPSVLVVDDNHDSAEMLRLLLGDLGYDCKVAHDAQEALRLVRDWVPQIAILDIGLPGMDGYELAQAIRRELAEDAPALIALTGYAQTRDRARALEVGFLEHLPKPIDAVRLETVLRGLFPRVASA